MNVLSLFDGMSCGQIALERAGIKVDNYYASEIEKKPIEVTMKNYPETIQIGDVQRIDFNDYKNCSLLIGGSPCQDLSRAKTDGKGLNGLKSKLFYEYVRAFQTIKPDYFLLENVVMNKESENIISSLLGVEPVRINSNMFTAQDRERLYWTNINFNKNIIDRNVWFKDVMESNVNEKFFLKDDFEKTNGLDHKIYGELKKIVNGKRRYTEMSSRVYNTNNKIGCLTAVSGGGQHKKVMDNGKPRRLTPMEYERLQTVPEGYTDCVSDSQRYKMLGNGWTVDVIAHILSYLKND